MKFFIIALEIMAGLVITSSCVGCDYYKEQTGYLVTHSEKFSHRYYDDIEVCGPELGCNIDEFRYILVHKGVRFTVHCENSKINNCDKIEVGEVHHCRFGSAFGDQWLDCEESHLELDSSQQE
jgi:arginine/ornithine N-succinyltransferase beta subunit